MLSTRFIKVKRPMMKLSDKFVGPFGIIEAIGANAMKLELPPTWRIHPIFIVSLLKPFLGKYRPESDTWQDEKDS